MSVLHKTIFFPHSAPDLNISLKVKNDDNYSPYFFEKSERNVLNKVPVGVDIGFVCTKIVSVSWLL